MFESIKAVVGVVGEGVSRLRESPLGKLLQGPMRSEVRTEAEFLAAIALSAVHKDVDHITLRLSSREAQSEKDSSRKGRLGFTTEAVIEARLFTNDGRTTEFHRVIGAYNVASDRETVAKIERVTQLGLLATIEQAHRIKERYPDLGVSAVPVDFLCRPDVLSSVRSTGDKLGISDEEVKAIFTP